MATTPPIFPKSPKNELFYGADWNPEQWPSHVWDEDVELMKDAGVNIVSIGVFSWAMIETGDEVWDFGWLDKVIDLAHRNDIAVNLATATGSPPPWLTTKHSEILPVTADGVKISPGARQHWRPTSPVFRTYALRLVRKLAERYRNHPAVVAWHVNNELGGHNLYDYSDDALVAFRNWLKERYTSIESLNFAWNTSFWSQHYNTFEEILPPRTATFFPNPGQQLDYARFSTNILSEYLDDERELLHQLSPWIPVTTNIMATRPTKGIDVSRWKVDFVSMDHYRVQAMPLEKDDLSFSAALTSGIAGGYPWFLQEHSTSAVNWQPTNVVKKPGEMTRDAITHVAHGADAVCFFQWRQSRAGAEKYHSSMIPHAGSNSKLFRSVCRLGSQLKDLAQIKDSRKAMAPIAILLDWESWWASELDSHPSNLVDYAREALEWYSALLSLGHRVDVLPSTSNFDAYKVVIAPIAYLVTDDLKARLESFVDGGGKFFTTYFSGIVDANDHIVLDGYPGAFRDLLGIRIEEFGPLPEGSVVELEGGVKGSLWTDDIEVTGNEVQVIRSYTSGDYKGQPAVTLNRFGKGVAGYVSTRLNVEGLRAVLPDLLNEIVSELPESIRGKVEYVIRTDGQKEWKFVINRTEEELDLSAWKGEVIAASGLCGGRLAGRGFAVFTKGD